LEKEKKMFYQQKKTYKQSQNKSNFPEDQQWNTNISQGSNSSNPKSQVYFEENRTKLKKKEKNEKENINVNQKQFEKKGYNPAKDNWEHNKYDENLSNPSSNGHRRNQKYGQQKNKNSRKPDRQLYVVREKQTIDEDPMFNVENKQKNEKRNVFSGKSPVKGSRRQDGKEESQQFDDDRSFVSNISTNFSEKQKPSDEEGRGTIMDFMPQMQIQNPKVLFEITIQNGRNVNSILVWDNEESYETFLDEICFSHKIGGEMAFYFKINLLKMIQNAQPNNKEVEMLINKLLDWNFEILKNEIKARGNISAHFSQTMNPVQTNLF